jgi:endo-1,4-beta-xylanase
MVDRLARVFLAGVFPVALVLAGCDVQGVLPSQDGGVGGTTSECSGTGYCGSGGSAASVDAGSGGSAATGDPADASTPAANLWADASFETGMDGWTPVGNARLSRSTEVSRTGAASLQVADRAMPWEGSGRNLMSFMTAGTTYEVSAWVRLASVPAEPVEVRLTLMRRCETDPQSGSYVAMDTTTTDGEWTQLLGSFDTPTCNPTELLAFIETGGITDLEATPDYYVDDVSLTVVP